MKIAGKRAILLMASFAWSGVAGSAELSGLEKCRDKERSQESVEAQLACYKALAEAQAGLHAIAEEPQHPAHLANSSGIPAPASREEGSVLLAEWAQDQQRAMTGYRQTYLLPLTNSSNPNNAPSSPNSNNQVPFSYALNDTEVKLQVSVKTRIVGLNDKDTIWVGYTQQSFWQLYDSYHSRPFRESNYEPELIFSHRYEGKPPILGLTPRIMNIVLNHQSNGQSNPRSRSWNRLYIQSGLERQLEGGSALIVMPRLWWRIFQEGNPLDNDNPDITNYLGYGDIELRYQRPNKAAYTLLLRARSLQMDLAYPIRAVHPLIQRSDLNFHVQYFTGYGESLIDYNQRHSRWGIGVSVPY